MGSGRPGLAGEPAVFHVAAGQDRGHVSVPALRLNMGADRAKATMCLLTSVIVTSAQVSHITFYCSCCIFFTLN